MYMREVTKHLALVCILREDSFEKQGMLNTIIHCIRLCQCLWCVWMSVCIDMRELVISIEQLGLYLCYTICYCKINLMV